MFGLDEHIAGWSQQGSILAVILVASLLGLRHATDPDHITAVTTLTASGRANAATALGAFWGLGHGLTLVGFGTPILLFRAYLPAAAQRGAEAAVGVLIVVLALRLMLRCRQRAAGQVPRHAVRGPRTAFAIGLVHGIGGSAGVVVLLLAAVPSTTLALISLVVFATFAGISMMFVTRGICATLSRHAAALPSVAPILAVFSLAFGIWYSAGALALAPYPF
jgi:high-affinity nickel permease